MWTPMVLWEGGAARWSELLPILALSLWGSLGISSPRRKTALFRKGWDPLLQLATCFSKRATKQWSVQCRAGFEEAVAACSLNGNGSATSVRQSTYIRSSCSCQDLLSAGLYRADMETRVHFFVMGSEWPGRTVILNISPIHNPVECKHIDIVFDFLKKLFKWPNYALQYTLKSTYLVTAYKYLLNIILFSIFEPSPYRVMNTNQVM